LEQYAYCPFRFLLETVIRARPLEEGSLEVDYMGRGQILHWLLAGLHRQLNESGGGPSSPGACAEERFLVTAEALVRQLLQRADVAGALAGGLLEIVGRQVMAWVKDYYHQHLAYDRQWKACSVPLRPAHFEVAFGPSRRDDDDELAVQAD